MKRAGIILIAGIVFALLTVYVINTQSPWDLRQVDAALERYSITTGEDFSLFVDESIELGLIWTLLDEKNVAVMLLMAGGAVVCLFASVHMMLDKLFIKKFYEQPDMRYAVRRGLFLYLFLVGMLLLRFIGGLVWYNSLAILVFLIVLEYAFTGSSSHTKQQLNTQSKDHA